MIISNSWDVADVAGCVWHVTLYYDVECNPYDCSLSGITLPNMRSTDSFEVDAPGLVD